MTDPAPRNQSSGQRGTAKEKVRNLHAAAVRRARIIGGQEWERQKRTWCHHCLWWHTPGAWADHAPGRQADCDACWPNEYDERGHGS